MNKLFKIKKQFIPILVSFVLYGCTPVMFIGAYNQNVDQSIQIISQDVSTLFVEIEKNIQDNKDFSYPVFRDEYIKIESEILSCKTVAGGLPKYRIIIKQIDLLDSSVLTLEQDHRAGFFNTANTNLTSEQKIKSVEVDHSAITNSLQSILTLQEALKKEPSK